MFYFMCLLSNCVSKLTEKKVFSNIQLTLEMNYIEIKYTAPCSKFSRAGLTLCLLSEKPLINISAVAKLA